MSKEKIRVANFSSAEKLLLLTIISEKYSKILEDKKTDRMSVSQKEQAWSQIEIDFNASSTTTFRNASCLKKCYENRKKELRKTVASHKRDVLLTGGGPPPKKKKDDDETLIDDILTSIMNEKTLVGLQNPFDDDVDENAIPQRNTQQFDTDTEFVLEVGSEYTSQIQTAQGVMPASNVMNWKRSTPNQLKQPISATLCAIAKDEQMAPQLDITTPNSSKARTPKQCSRRRPTTVVKTLTLSDIAKKYNILLDKRISLLDAQHKHMEKENELILKKHQLEIALLTRKLKRDEELDTEN
ncbi:myb/SANT-like DNA-binding domain-containing protein 3 [Photinus pyralis]|uniref:myb/SANT-like DNA-binding domain-containing protein 3 n=1 Tax=Photinus pyralis TaxID=7054 RepID=UPI0012673DB6|nr:myb/SANT-like DNA-binding domain-containing protein 3 [Photinus pyralis]